MKLTLLLLSMACSLLQAVDVSTSIAPVGFRASMQRYGQYLDLENLKRPEWALYKELYRTYRKKSFAKDAAPIIPRLIHFVWLGGPIPERDQQMIETWRKFHPEPLWKVIVWTDKDLPAFQLKNQRAYEYARSYQEKSNLFRYEILERMGGLYVDTDIACFRPVDEIHQSAEFYCGIQYEELPLLCNGLIGCTPHHPIMQKCVERIGTEYCGPPYFTRAFEDTVREDMEHAKGTIVPFPVTYFYPLGYVLESHLTSENIEALTAEFICPESFAMHYWAGSRPGWGGKRVKMPAPLITNVLQQCPMTDTLGFGDGNFMTNGESAILPSLLREKSAVIASENDAWMQYARALVPSIQIKKIKRERLNQLVDLVRLDCKALPSLMEAKEALQKQHLRAVVFEYKKGAAVSLKQVVKLFSACNYVLFRITPKGVVHVAAWEREPRGEGSVRYLALPQARVPQYNALELR